MDMIAFIGGGNMASAIIGGLLKQGLPAGQIQVVEPFAEQRAKLTQQFGVQVHEGPGAWLATAGLVVWAVKPQVFKDAALQTRFHTKTALHLSAHRRRQAGDRKSAQAHGRLPVAGGRGPARCGDRTVGLGPGLRVLFH